MPKHLLWPELYKNYPGPEADDFPVPQINYTHFRQILSRAFCKNLLDRTTYEKLVYLLKLRKNFYVCPNCRFRLLCLAEKDLFSIHDILNGSGFKRLQYLLEQMLNQKKLEEEKEKRYQNDEYCDREKCVEFIMNIE
ncbi:hypothetical protein SNEBB_008721 [Seison nebaliae]|nr:hypothetical protein SNEBB_008721 [Seison nebaliae]